MLLGVFDRLGFPVAMDKLEGPWSCLTFLDFELDSSVLKIWLAQAKLRELQHLLAPGWDASPAYGESWSCWWGSWDTPAV